MKTFGDKLKDARTAKALKQSEVAEKLNCAPTSLTNWENGKVQPSLDVLSRICEVYGISELDLLDKRYSYNDILGIAQKAYKERSYEEQIALNFSGAILEKSSDKEIKRLEKERENKDYISETTGLTPAAVAALTVDFYDVLEESNESKISPAGLEALNRLLTCKDGLSALDNIAVYLRAGDYRFADGVKVVRVDVGSFTAPGRTVDKAFYLAPDMTKAIAKDEFLRQLDSIKTRLPQEELNSATEQFRDDMKKRKG